MANLIRDIVKIILAPAETTSQKSSERVKQSHSPRKKKKTRKSVAPKKKSAKSKRRASGVIPVSQVKTDPSHSYGHKKMNLPYEMTKPAKKRISQHP